MTESEFLANDDPAAMLRGLYVRHNCDEFGANRGDGTYGISDRKIHLWSEAVYELAGSDSHLAYEYLLKSEPPSEHWLREGQQWEPSSRTFCQSIPAGHRAAACNLLRDIVGNPWRPVVLCGSIHPVVQLPVDPKCPGCAPILRWNDGTVPKLAAAIYEDRTFERIPILADALEEAGYVSAPAGHEWERSGFRSATAPCVRCGVQWATDAHRAVGKRCVADTDILAHLRGPGPHVRGCWVVDLLLGKE